MAEPTTRLWALQSKTDAVTYYAVRPDWPLDLIKIYRMMMGQDTAFPQLHDIVGEEGAKRIEAELRRVGFVDL